MNSTRINGSVVPHLSEQMLGECVSVHLPPINIYPQQLIKGKYFAWTNYTLFILYPLNF